MHRASDGPSVNGAVQAMHDQADSSDRRVSVTEVSTLRTRPFFPRAV